MIDCEQVKADNNTLLRACGIQVNEFLPLRSEESDLTPPGAADVARRSMVLLHVMGVGLGGDALELKEAVEDWGLWPYASKKERDLLSRSTHTEQELIDAKWLVECAQSFAWCLGLAGLPHLAGCEDDLVTKFPEPFADPAEFIASATLRPYEEIYRQADYHYRLHWAARQARLTGEEFGKYEGLVWERRRALDWALGVAADWDDVPDGT